MIAHITPRESAIAAIASDYQHEALAWSINAENAFDHATAAALHEATALLTLHEAMAQIERLQGEARVMTGLLAEAVAVLQTIEPECATEDERLTRLRGDIWAVLTAWAKRGGE